MMIKLFSERKSTEELSTDEWARIVWGVWHFFEHILVLIKALYGY